MNGPIGVNEPIVDALRQNSFDYFERVLITENGFREYDVRWILGKEINPNGFCRLGRAYGTFVQRSMNETRVVVGHDFRSYSQDLLRSFTVGLLSAGIEVIDIGLALTPMVYFAQHRFDVRGAAMVTASHNENGWTGLKLADGLSSTLGPDGIQEFRRIVFDGRFVEGRGSYQAATGLIEAYRDDLLAGGRLPGLKRVVVAAGNGTAGRFVPEILRELGCETIELDCDGDWTFPRHNPNPEDLAFVQDIGAMVRETHADLGIGIDGDGDRLGVVDDSGRVVYSDRLGLLVARWIAKTHPGRRMVIDVKSTGLFESDPVLAANGVAVDRWKTGHSYIKAKVAETGAIAGFEKSGHWFLAPPYGRGYDDAPLAAVVLLRLIDGANRPLSDLLDELPKAYQSPTLGVHCSDATKYEAVDRFRERIESDRSGKAEIAGSAIKSIETLNGVRFSLEAGSWGLVRASSNKPSLVIVAESMTSRDQMVAIVRAIKERLEQIGVRGKFDQDFPDM